jgi:protoporphyrinogen/coproporphyrinogen III oxidase
MARIAIVGGGLTGVSTAYELSRQGHADFVLYEVSSRLGGIVETHRQDGFIIECGADSWVTEKPWARELAIELGLEAEIIPSDDAHRRTYVLEDGRLTPLPDGMRMMVPGDLDAIAHSPLFSEEAKRAYREESARAEELQAFAAARLNEKGDGEDESVASFVRRHFGDEVTEKVAGPLLAGVFGGDIGKFSAAAVMAVFLKMEREHGSLILALQKQRRDGAAKRSVFTSLSRGLQSLIEGMTAALPPAAIRLREPVLSLARVNGGWEVTTASGASLFDAVVIATPVPVTRELVALLHPELRELLDIEATSAVVAAFAFDREASARIKIPEGFGFLVPQRAQTQASASGPELLAATFVNQKFAHRAPDGCVLIRTFFGGDAAPPLLSWSDAEILALAHRNLSRVLGELPEPKITLVRRWPRSMPQYHVGHLARVAHIEAITAEFPRLRLIGNGFHGVGLPDLIHQGRQTALALLSS